ncbi:MAG: hypothetical protein R8K20_00805 [Gallionellaceae bacterium]
MNDSQEQLESLISLIKRSVKTQDNREQEGVAEARLMNALGSDFTKRSPKNILGTKSISISHGVDKNEWAKRQEAAALLIEAGRPLPDYLRNHAAGVLRGERNPPSKTVNKNSSRNFFIACAVVAAARELNLLPTRNDESKSESACDIVASKVFMSYKAVKAIYFKERDFAEAAEIIWLKYSNKT